MKMSEIALNLGISVSQVSRALSNKRGVRDSVRQQVLELARKNAYRNDSPVHRKTVVIVFRKGTPYITLRKYGKRFRRKDFHVIYMLPTAVSFLSEFLADSVYVLDLSPQELDLLIRQKTDFHFLQK